MYYTPIRLIVLLLVAFAFESSVAVGVNFTVYSVLPAHSLVAGGQVVVIKGELFYPSNNIKCNFILDDDTQYIVNGTYVSATNIECTSPKVNDAGDYYIEISEDGENYSNDNVVFNYKEEETPEEAGAITGIIVLVVLFSLTFTGVGVYVWRKRKQRKLIQEIQDAEVSFSLLPGMDGTTQDPRHTEL